MFYDNQPGRLEWPDPVRYKIHARRDYECHAANNIRARYAIHRQNRNYLLGRVRNDP